MIRRYVGIVCGALLFASSVSPWTLAAPPDVADIPDAARPVPGTLVPAHDGLGVRVLSHQAEWTSFFSMGGGSESVFLITGQVKNLKDTPLSYVKFQYELLGQDDIVVFRDYGYNRKAEALRDEDYESGTVSFADKGIEHIKAGAHESFRFLFFENDVPEFSSYRIRVIESK